jgi:catechol-2,3-dioxygenase
MSDYGLTRLQHLVLWVADVERSARFYCDVVGFEVQPLPHRRLPQDSRDR